LGVQLSGWDVSLFINNATNNHPLLTYLNDAPGGAIFQAAAVRPLSGGITVQSRF